VRRDRRIDQRIWHVRIPSGLAGQGHQWRRIGCRRWPASTRPRPGRRALRCAGGAGYTGSCPCMAPSCSYHEALRTLGAGAGIFSIRRVHRGAVSYTERSRPLSAGGAANHPY
jgi:hypothetical protein